LKGATVLTSETWLMSKRVHHSGSEGASISLIT
jgi:hypothetical protein